MIIYGIHSCKNAIESRKDNVLRVYVLKDKALPEWISVIPPKKIVKIDNIEFKKLVPKDAVHQGIAVEVEQNYADITDLVSAPKNCIIAILDNVTDPQNLGAIIRTAAAFGVYGIILSERASCKITGTVAKTASGGLDHISIYMVKNLSQAIEKLQEYGFWVVSFCERGQKFIHEVDLKGKTCLIFGAEGDGIRRLQKEKSDFVVKLPTNPCFPTLNVSSSAAVAFYEAAKQNGFNSF